MRAFITAATIATLLTGTAAAEQRAQYQQVRPASIDPRQVGIDDDFNAPPRSKAEAARARCLKRKVKERRACLAEADAIAASEPSK